MDANGDDDPSGNDEGDFITPAPEQPSGGGKNKVH
jgi:hypothetical protein